ncbi:hypothetical protein QTP86_008344 [Hemibagrus guttatus]|nr:hypothetical protein QTP86_008344 [Hemibagrus guttatus]
MLFVDYSSAFNTIIPSALTTKLQHLGLSPSLCQWISIFLTGRPQAQDKLIVDFSTKQERNYQTPVINESPVERVDSFRYLGVHITQDLSWSCHINTVVKKARQHLYHLRRLRDFRLPSKVLRKFYSCTIGSILTGNIATWFGNSTMQDRRALKRVMRSADAFS